MVGDPNLCACFCRTPVTISSPWRSVPSGLVAKPISTIAACPLLSRLLRKGGYEDPQTWGVLILVSPRNRGHAFVILRALCAEPSQVRWCPRFAPVFGPNLGLLITEHAAPHPLSFRAQRGICFAVGFGLRQPPGISACGPRPASLRRFHDHPDRRRRDRLLRVPAPAADKEVIGQLRRFPHFVSFAPFVVLRHARQNQAWWATGLPIFGSW